ncbi:hypothetical protein BC831DRAFT_259263 [Entophlyctis helioformis]|nr:hypothetical protein BC831DRAFT_259263 [Entophlyctis helioformis]
MSGRSSAECNGSGSQQQQHTEFRVWACSGPGSGSGPATSQASATWTRTGRRHPQTHLQTAGWTGMDGDSTGTPGGFQRDSRGRRWAGRECRALVGRTDGASGVERAGAGSCWETVGELAGEAVFGATGHRRLGRGRWCGCGRAVCLWDGTLGGSAADANRLRAAALLAVCEWLASRAGSPSQAGERPASQRACGHEPSHASQPAKHQFVRRTRRTRRIRAVCCHVRAAVHLSRPVIAESLAANLHSKPPISNHFQTLSNSAHSNARQDPPDPAKLSPTQPTARICQPASQTARHDSPCCVPCCSLPRQSCSRSTAAATTATAASQSRIQVHAAIATSRLACRPSTHKHHRRPHLCQCLGACTVLPLRPELLCL